MLVWHLIQCPAYIKHLVNVPIICIIIIIVITVIITVVISLIYKYGMLTLQRCCFLPPLPAIILCLPAIEYYSYLPFVIFYSPPCSIGICVFVLYLQLCYKTK